MKQQIDIKLQKSTDIMIHYVLTWLREEDNDSFIVFGTDIWKGPDDFNEALTYVSEVHKYESEESEFVTKRFEKYGLKIEEFIREDETCILIGDSCNTKFYQLKEKRIKDIEKNWKLHYTSKKYGLS